MAEEPSEYERQRLENIKRNQRVLVSLGLAGPSLLPRPPALASKRKSLAERMQEKRPERKSSRIANSAAPAEERDDGHAALGGSDAASTAATAATAAGHRTLSSAGLRRETQKGAVVLRRETQKGAVVRWAFTQGPLEGIVLGPPLRGAKKCTHGEDSGHSYWRTRFGGSPHSYWSGILQVVLRADRERPWGAELAVGEWARQPASATEEAEEAGSASALSSAPLRQVEASPGPLGLRFRMCQDSGHALVDDILPRSPLSEFVAIGDLLVAVDEVATRQLGTSDKVPLPSLETRACSICRTV